MNLQTIVHHENSPTSSFSSPPATGVIQIYLNFCCCSWSHLQSAKRGWSIHQERFLCVPLDSL